MGVLVGRTISCGITLLFIACGSVLSEADRIARRASGTAPVDTPLSSAKDLTAFSFTSLSTGLSAGYSATIAGNTVQINLPYGIGLNALVPTFSHTGVSVTVAGVSQQSGVTANNFSGVVSYVVTAQDGSSRAYNVSVTQIVSVQDTGMATCYGMGVTLGSCNDATFPRQDGDFAGSPALRSVEAPSTNAGFPADYISRDRANGIAWKTCAQGLSDPTCATGFAGTQTLAAATTACSTLNTASGYAGLTNWRLPSALELMQLQYHVTNGVFYDATRFPGAVHASHWSSTTIPSTINAVRIGPAFAASGVGSSWNVRCVAGAAYPASSWFDQGDGTVRDRRTGLIWQKCAVGQANDATCSGTITGTGRTWSAALTDCTNLTLAGRTWRLPNITEALSLIDFSVAATPFVNAAFVNFPASGSPVPHLWTSTTALANSSYAYVINYYTATASTIDAKSANVTGSHLYYSRCVSGP